MRQKRTLEIVLVFLISFSLFGIAVYAQDYTPSTLILDVFSDGSVNVEFVIEPDPILAKVNVTLIGKTIEDVLVVDSDGIILDWDLYTEVIEVDGLGLSEITLSYSTPSLTNKTGSLWSVSATSPVNAIISLPKDSVLVGLSPAPIGISVTDNRATITMPTGTFRVSYVLGTTGTREHALVLLNDAERTVEEADQAGVVVTEAEEVLAQARTAYMAGQYTQSETLSRQVTEMVQETIVLAGEALNTINDADALIQSKTGQYNQDALDSARSMLDSAEEEYSAGEYQTALADAEEAYSTALDAEPISTTPATGGNQTLLMAGGLVVIIVAAGYMYVNRQKQAPVMRPEPTIVDVDLNAVFKDRPHLRTDDKAVLRYIQETGGAFVTDVRERFDIPKSSAWRMVKRLEEEGLVEVTSVGRESHLQLKEPEEEP
ncbi:MAG: MarR family transcriptional regulator [Candidatus Bathyarchaeota archaeon]|nr:MarR family transcriptional regulator [Candidatus Bathyarchaeota archaeon]